MRIANKPYLLQRRSNKDPGGRGNPSLASHRDAEVKFSWSLTLSLLMSILSSWSRVACKDLIRVEQCVFLLDPKPRTMFFGSLHHQVAGFPLAKSPKNQSKKSMLQNVFEEIVFTCGLCELVSCCTCKSHTAQSCCFLVWDQIMHFFCQKKDNISRLVGIPKEGHQVSGLMRSREGVILRTIGTWMGPYKGLQDGGRHRNCCPPPSSCSSHQSSKQEAL